MSDPQIGTLLFPRHVRVSASPDKTQLAFTFGFEDQTPVTIALPIAGAVVLQRNLAQCLYLLGVTQPPRPAEAAAAQPAPAPEKPDET